MKRWLGWLATVLAVVLITLGPVGNVFADMGPDGWQGSGYAHQGDVRLVVRYKDSIGVEETGALAAMTGGRVVARIRALNAVVFEVPAEQAAQALRLLRSNPHVLYAEPDAVAEAAFTPNDPEYSLHQYGPQIIQANRAWDITKGSPDILVAVVDTGVDYTHPELANKVVLGYDFVNNDADPMDDNGHGTHVAGIIAAATNNGIGVASIGYNTRVLAVKVLSATGSGFYSTVAQGITYAADHGARIINLSLRGTVASNILQDAINYAWNKGVLVVAAAGNDGSNAPVYPAAYPHVLAVAATDWNDAHWSLSNYGDYVDIAAPGVGIFSTDWAGGAGPYASRSGTSMAAPHVAEVAALALAVNPDLTNADLESLLMNTADDKGDPGWDPYYGAGRVNAYRAVVAAQEAARSVQGAAVGDRVWLDANGNGLQDPGESGVANVVVELHQADGTLVASTTTDASGQYAFTNVPAGDYYLRVVSPTGYVFTLANQGSDDLADSDVDRGSGRTPVFTLAPGQSDASWDAGLIPTVRLGGYTWVDANANAIRDPDEQDSVPNVPVHITGTDITGASVDATVASDGNGHFLVDTLLPGTYQVEVPHAVQGYVLTTSPDPATVVLTAQSREALNVNFGYIAPTWVNLLAFVIVPDGKGLHLRWRVALTGGDVPGFYVARRVTQGTWQRLTSHPILPLVEDGQTATYEFWDTQVQPGKTYAYRLETVSGATFGPWTAQVPAHTDGTSPSAMFLPFLTH